PGRCGRSRAPVRDQGRFRLLRRRSSGNVTLWPVDAATGCLIVNGQKIFPIGLAEAPQPDGQTPDGRNAWAEVASAGVNFVRSGLREWNLQQIDAQIAAERARMDAAAAQSMFCWPRLGNAGNLPAAQGSVEEQILVKL